MARTTTTTLAGLMALGVLGACSQTTSDTAPADTTDQSMSTTTAPDTTAPGTTTSSQTMDSTTTPPATGQTGTAPQPAAPAASAPTPATQADLTTGANVSDINGQAIGTIETVDAAGAVVNAGGQRVKLPVNSFGKTSAGLVIGTTKADFDAQVAASRAAQPGTAPGAQPPAGSPATPPQ